MVQSVKCLPLKHEDLRLDPQHPQKQQGIVAVCTCNTSAGGGERQEDLWACWPGSPAKLGSYSFSEGSCLRERWIVIEKDTQC